MPNSYTDGNSSRFGLEAEFHSVFHKCLLLAAGSTDRC